MKRYLVELEAGEREALEAITRKGSHRSQKVLNALVLLNCDAGECNERRATGPGDRPGCCGSARAGWTGSRSGLWRTVWKRRLGPGRVVERNTFARRTGNSRRASSRSAAAIRPRALAVVATPAGGPRGGTRLHRQRLARDGAARC